MHNRRHWFERKSPNTGKMLGLSLFAASVGAAVSYFLYGTEEGARKRKEMRHFADKIKEYSMETAGEIKNASKEIYDNTASLLKERYEDIKNMDKMEIKELGNRIREHWIDIKEDIEGTIDKAIKKPGHIA